MALINERIRERREYLKYSQDELANKLGYKSRSTIAKIESGKNDISQSKIQAFADALETTPSYLMGFETERKENSLNKVAPISEIYTILCKELLKNDFLEFLQTNHKNYLESNKFFDKVYEGIEINAFSTNVEEILSKGLSVCGTGSCDFTRSEEIFFMENIDTFIYIIENNVLEICKLIQSFLKLNDIGREKSISYMFDLTENIKYTNKENNFLKLE